MCAEADAACHPGRYLRELMDRGGHDRESLARLLRMPDGALDGVLDGRSDMTLDLAVRLSAAFGMSALYWLDLQNAYDERAGRTRPDERGDQSA